MTQKAAKRDDYYRVMILRKKAFYRTILLPLALSLALSACKFNTENDLLPTENDDLASAVWIGVREDLPLADSLLYNDHPSPIFRKEFTAKKNIRSATLYISSAGYYRASLNGERIGLNFLDPAWTDVSKRVYYSEYDLTSEIKEGANSLGVTLGNGFYNLLPMKMWGVRNLREAVPSGKPVFIARLEIEYENGDMDEIVTDNSWEYGYGPIVKNNVYLGETYDAGREIKAWKTATHSNGPGGKLQKAFFPPIQIAEKITPLAISPTDDNKYIVDMGVNFTGLYEIHLHGKPGDTITFRFGERVYDDGTLNPMTTVAGQIKSAGKGGPGAPAIAWQADTYIFGDETEAWYRPEFTFHTYRYMEISGLDKAPDLSDIQGIALNSAVQRKNDFSSSSELINGIQEACKQTFLSNLVGVQSDCAAREKFGYGGDLNATSEAFIYNFNMKEFYRKTLYDWVDAMNDSGFVDTAPFVGIQYCGISWESAFITTQYKLLQYYNDTATIKEFYELDLKWMDKAASIHPDGIVETGLSDHESLEPVPVELTGTSHYLQCARIMKTFAAYMGDRKREEQFEELANKLSKIVLEKYWREPLTEPINKQTLYASLLYFDIIPPRERGPAIDSLIKSVSAAPGGHFTTGIFGTKYILEALSKTGHTDLVYDIVNSTSYPGWGHMIDRGATTIWETWKESDNTYSNCHPMFGSVSEWFYRWLGGIRPMPEYPGFEKFIINPGLPEGLSEVATSYHSPFGEIVSEWKNHGNEKQVFKISVPEGSTASVKLPASKQQEISFSENTNGGSISLDRTDEKYCSFELPPGQYTILLTLNL